VTAVTGSPATSFTQVVRQQVGRRRPPRHPERHDYCEQPDAVGHARGLAESVAAGLPFKPTFNASTLFAGQVVAVQTGGVSNNAATAQTVFLAPQTVSGTITGASCHLHSVLGSTHAHAARRQLAGHGDGTNHRERDCPHCRPSGASGRHCRDQQCGALQRLLFNSNGVLTLVPVVEGPAPGTQSGEHLIYRGTAT